LAVSDALEALIANGTDTVADREYAYRTVSAHTADTAADTFARTKMDVLVMGDLFAEAVGGQ